MTYSSTFERLRGLPQCVQVPIERLTGHATAALLNTLNGLTFIETTHTAGLLGRGPTSHQFSLARPTVAGTLDTRATLTEQQAATLVDVWEAQARALGLPSPVYAAAEA